MNTSFKIGDIVSVRSGGGSMTVEKIDGEKIGCMWMDGTTLKQHVFSSALIAMNSSQFAVNKLKEIAIAVCNEMEERQKQRSEIQTEANKKFYADLSENGL